MSRFLIPIFLFLSLTPSLHARKLLGAEKLAFAEENSVQNAVSTENSVPPPSPPTMKRFSSLDAGLFLSALPKGGVPPSSPSNKGHAVVVDEKLFTMHLTKMDRILTSVPSPGVGH
ncbi:hypothetical protein ACLOJK_010688 [Asimina triloba]